MWLGWRADGVFNYHGRSILKVQHVSLWLQSFREGRHGYRAPGSVSRIRLYNHHEILARRTNWTKNGHRNPWRSKISFKRVENEGKAAENRLKNVYPFLKAYLWPSIIRPDIFDTRSYQQDKLHQTTIFGQDIPIIFHNGEIYIWLKTSWMVFFKRKENLGVSMCRHRDDQFGRNGGTWWRSWNS